MLNSTGLTSKYLKSVIFGHFTETMSSPEVSSTILNATYLLYKKRNSFGAVSRRAPKLSLGLVFELKANDSACIRGQEIDPNI